MCLQVFYLNPATSKQAKHSFPKLAVYRNHLEHFKTIHIFGPAPDLGDQKLQGQSLEGFRQAPSALLKQPIHSWVQGGFIQRGARTPSAHQPGPENTLPKCPERGQMRRSLADIREASGGSSRASFSRIIKSRPPFIPSKGRQSEFLQLMLV